MIDQMKGCSPSPVTGIGKILAKRFQVKDVDEVLLEEMVSVHEIRELDEVN